MVGSLVRSKAEYKVGGGTSLRACCSAREGTQGPGREAAAAARGHECRALGIAPAREPGWLTDAYHRLRSLSSFALLQNACKLRAPQALKVCSVLLEGFTLIFCYRGLEIAGSFPTTRLKQEIVGKFF